MIEKIIEVGRRYGIEVERRQAKEWSMKKSKLSRLFCMVVEDVAAEEGGGLAMNDVRHRKVLVSLGEEVKSNLTAQINPEKRQNKIEPTAPESYDGSKVNFHAIDETGQMPVDPEGQWKKIRQVLASKSEAELMEKFDRDQDESDKKSFIETMSADPPEWGKLVTEEELEEYVGQWVADVPGQKNGWKSVGGMYAVCVEEVNYRVGGIGIAVIEGLRWKMVEGGKLEKLD